MSKSIINTIKTNSCHKKDYEKILKSCVVKNDHKLKGVDKGKLFSLTTIACSPQHGGDRTIAIFDDFNKAKEVVEQNIGDIWECSYMLCVIESVTPNSLYGGLGKRTTYWYKWFGGDKGKYKPIRTPRAYKNIFGFGIG